jgi:hypothetical protein
MFKLLQFDVAAGSDAHYALHRIECCTERLLEVTATLTYRPIELSLRYGMLCYRLNDQSCLQSCYSST